MIKSKHITIFIVILICGLIVEGLKGVKGLDSSKSDSMSGFSLQEMDTKPFYVSQHDKNSSGSRVDAQGGRTRGGFKLSATQADLTKNILSKTNSVAAADGDAKTDAEKKKKKKKKKKVAKNRRLFKPQIIAEKNTETKKDGVHESDASKASQFVSQFNPNAQPENALPISYDDWAKLILGRPQPDNVAKLIEYYSNNMVSADIFYSILSAMLEESDQEQHKLAVFAAGNVPNALSFIFLVQVLKTDSQGSPASIKAVEQITSYQTLHNVVHLKSVLSSPLADINVVQMAVNALDKATQQLLENRTPAEDYRAPSAQDGNILTGADQASATTDANNEAKSEAAKQINIRKTFTGFEPVLVQVIQTYQAHPSITEPAQRSLTRIQKLTVVLADMNG
ncbi:MAG: hypothetical protein KDD38_03200 [Bdellovibrionales bacterium]|nr:hypothetical protein [Bdellovibrionales bacterium]